MVKSIIKEIIIILLLLVAIVLALGVLFYDYLPTNKIVPSVETYATSTTVKAELDEEIEEQETVIITYEITSNDLKTYEKTNDYVKGKVNPFSTYSNTVDGDEETNTTSSNSTSGTSTSSSSTSTNSSSSSSTYYSNTGTK